MQQVFVHTLIVYRFLLYKYSMAPNKVGKKYQDRSKY